MALTMMPHIVQVGVYGDCIILKTNYIQHNRYSKYPIFVSPSCGFWEHCGVVVCTRDPQSEGCGFESHPVRMPLDKAFCSQLSLPGVVTGYPVGICSF